MGYKVTLTEKAKDFLSEKGYDPQYGARPLNRAIQKYLEDRSLRRSSRERSTKEILCRLITMVNSGVEDQGEEKANTEKERRRFSRIDHKPHKCWGFFYMLPLLINAMNMLMAG